MQLDDDDATEQSEEGDTAIDDIQPMATGVQELLDSNSH